MCQKLQIDPTSIANFLQNKPTISRWEYTLADQLSEQLVHGDLILESYDTLCTSDDPLCDQAPEHADEYMDFDFDSEYEERANKKLKKEKDPDYTPETEASVHHLHRDEVSTQRWEAAYRFYTNQTDTSKPVNLSDEFLSGCKTESIARTKYRFRFLTDGLKNLKRWREGIINKRTTFRTIDKLVYERFQEARSKFLRVNDRLIRQWAIQIKNDQFHKMSFTASPSWLHNFKRRHNIVSRTITHKVGKDYWKNQAKLAQIEAAFVREVQQVILAEGFRPNEILNCDQSRFDKELHGHKTHAIKGDKQVEATVGSINATTHSYCVMPIISMAGQLVGPLYVLSQESGGKWPITKPPVVQPNVAAYPGTSAMMTNNHLRSYLKDVFFPSVIQTGVDKCLLLCDSWSSNRNNKLFDEEASNFPQLTVRRMIIPPKTTCHIQPLDVGYFRHFKSFARTICDTLEITGNMGQRQHYLNLQSFLHHQFGAPRFKNLIQRAFVKCGYTEDRTGQYDEVPAKFCLDFTDVVPCFEGDCLEWSNIKCAHCERMFCYQHAFLNKVHLCTPVLQ